MLLLAFVLTGCATNSDATARLSGIGVTQTGHPNQQSPTEPSDSLVPPAERKESEPSQALSAERIATRVAFAAHTDPQWWITVAEDLDPAFTDTLATTRVIGEPEQAPVPETAAAPPLILISVTQDTKVSARWLVTFNDTTTGTNTKTGVIHITAITLNPNNQRRLLVTNVEPLT